MSPQVCLLVNILMVLYKIKSMWGACHNCYTIKLGKTNWVKPFMLQGKLGLVTSKNDNEISFLVLVKSKAW